MKKYMRRRLVLTILQKQLSRPGRSKSQGRNASPSNSIHFRLGQRNRVLVYFFSQPAPREKRSPLGNGPRPRRAKRDRKSTRLNSSHLVISYAVFCLKKKKK